MSPDATAMVEPEASTVADEAAVRAAPSAWEPLAVPSASLVRRLAIVLGGLVGAAALGALLAVALQFRPLPSTGAIEGITEGALQVQSAREGPWLAAQAGALLRPRARVQSTVGSVAAIALGQGAWMRIESDGEWWLADLQASRNGRLVRAAIVHERGQASYVSRPPQPGVEARLRVTCAGATLDLTGVATLVCDEATATVWVRQGEARLSAWGQHVRLGPGESVRLDPQQRAIVPGP